MKPPTALESASLSSRLAAAYEEARALRSYDKEAFDAISTIVIACDTVPDAVVDLEPSFKRDAIACRLIDRLNEAQRAYDEAALALAKHCLDEMRPVEVGLVAAMRSRY